MPIDEIMEHLARSRAGQAFDDWRRDNTDITDPNEQILHYFYTELCNAGYTHYKDTPLIAAYDELRKKLFDAVDYLVDDIRIQKLLYTKRYEEAVQTAALLASTTVLVVMLERESKREASCNEVDKEANKLLNATLRVVRANEEFRKALRREMLTE